MRGWLENHAAIEIVDRDMRGQYERFFQLVFANSSPKDEAGDMG